MTGDVRFAPLTSGRYLVSWSEIGRRCLRLCHKILDADLQTVFEIDAIELPRQHFGFEVAATGDGGFVVAWTDKSVVRLKRYDSTGLCGPSIGVGHTTKSSAAVQLAIFTTGEIGIGCADFLSIHTDVGLLLCAVRPESWHANVACQSNGTLVRVEVIGKHPSYPGPPIYELHGLIVDRFGIGIRQFRFGVPSAIVGETYSHPDHLTICCLPDAGFVVVWTQLGHHLGNSIQAQIFDKEGAPIGETFIVVAAQPNSSVNNPSVAAMNDGGFLIAWTVSEDPYQNHEFQHFSEDGQRRGNIVPVDEASSEGRGAAALTKILSGEVIAYWFENGKIEIRLMGPYIV